MADPENTLPSITYWLMGSLSNVMMSDLTYVLLMMVVFAIPLFLLSWQLNALSLGEDEARSLGVETKRLRIIAILCSTLLPATSLSIGGLIGWVGLVIPHWSRMLSLIHISKDEEKFNQAVKIVKELTASHPLYA